ncbi:hypothetical protein ACE38W_15780 [Chitinophaga sp. Hz27]|uniref:hypothetical protein n=1 Tax=Chitinophaga sp. Hz27 TaxID=3347169 RepID=UPI0035DE4EA5
MNPDAIKRSYWSKLIATVFVAIAIVNSYSSVVFFRLSLIPGFTLNSTIYKYLFPLLLLVGIVFAVAFPIYWQWKEKTKNTLMDQYYTWFIAIIRYWLALEISGYGFGKIFHNQFGESFVRNDSIVSHLSGYGLTWNYFGYSYLFSCAVAIIQIGGSILLLFRRTTLLAVVLLLPVLINIVLIDLCYDIPLAATRNAIFFTAALLYLLVLHWHVLLPIVATSFLKPLSAGVGIKTMVRVLIIGSSLAFAIYVANFVTNKQQIAGKWEVMQATKNEQQIPAAAWLTDSTSWKNIYIENYRRITCSPNPYVVEEKRAQNGEYFLNSRKDTIKLLIFHRKEPIFAAVNYIDNDHMEWRYSDGMDKILLKLTRASK